MHKVTLVGHPQSNSEVEMTNRTILHGFKIRLNEVKDLWMKESYPILRTYWTTPRISIGKSSFNLASGTEAVIPMEIGLPSMRVK